MFVSTQDKYWIWIWRRFSNGYGWCRHIRCWCCFNAFKIGTRTTSRAILLNSTLIIIEYHNSPTSQGQLSCRVLKLLKQSSSHSWFSLQALTHLPSLILLSSMHRFQSGFSSITFILCYYFHQMSVNDGLIETYGKTYLTTADRIVAIFAAIKTIKLARTILISC